MAGTGFRNRHKIGDYLMRDDESGFTEYRSNMARIWDGTWRRKNQFETRQPQEFVYARNDPKALRHIRPEEPGIAPDNFATATIQDTGLPTPQGAAFHIFDPAIPDMVIGTSFFVR